MVLEVEQVPVLEFGPKIIWSLSCQRRATDCE